MREMIVSEGLDFCAFLGGFRDVEAAILAGYPHHAIVDAVEARLDVMASMLGVPLIFGGLCKLGDLGTRALVTEIHRRLFNNTEVLRAAGVIFVDCSSPSWALNGDRVWEADGGFNRMFRANCLFMLSQLVAVSLDNLVTPSSSAHATVELGSWVKKMMKKRASDL